MGRRGTAPTKWNHMFKEVIPMSASANVQKQETSAEEIKQGVREVYAARIAGDAGAGTGGATAPASTP